jgi:hypothetical protein
VKPMVIVSGSAATAGVATMLATAMIAESNFISSSLSPRSIALDVIIGCCERAEAARPSSPLGSLSPFPARNAAPAIEFPAGPRRSVRYVAPHTGLGT